MDNEKIVINDRILQYGVVSNGTDYQVYLYPGMTVAEMAFDVMVTIRLLEQDGYIKDKAEFDALINKYYNDPQYAPITKQEVPDEQN
jgi:hypothetical protein